jgi:phosphatidylglycerophosphatase C
MNLALFDFDGTITTADTFTPFLRFAVRRERILVGCVIFSPLMTIDGGRSPTGMRRPVLEFSTRAEGAVA